jgi:extradiol dioxygenase family protein
VFDPAKGLLHNDHFQVAYVTNDLERAEQVFRDRFGVPDFRANDNELPSGARVGVRSVWIGRMMYEICFGAGPGMELYTDWAPPDGEFVLRFHHYGYLVPDETAWAALERQIEAGGWRVRTRSDVPGFFRGCYVEAPELGHYLEFVLPREALLERLNATPVA